MSTRENPPSSWTYRMEVSPTGQTPGGVSGSTTDPVVLLHALINLQSQTLDIQRQILENSKAQLDLAKEAAQIARDQRSRQIGELERWQTSHNYVIDDCKAALGQLESVHASLMGEMATYVDEHHAESRRGRLCPQRLCRPLRPPACSFEHDAGRASPAGRRTTEAG